VVPEDRPGRQDPRPSRYSEERYSGWWRFLWVVVGVHVYAAAMIGISGPERRSPRLAIHPTSGKGYSANFALKAFLEVQLPHSPILYDTG
jgi:hypothetical protein